MLHRVHIVRLAFHHSPEKEQRLLSFAKDPNDPNPSNLEQTPEGSDAHIENPELDIVDQLRAQTAQDIAESAPEMILKEIKSRENMLELLLTSGALSENVDSVLERLDIKKLHEFDISALEKLDMLEPEHREAFVELLLEECDEQQAIRIIEATNAKLERYDELMRPSEKQLKSLLKNTKDPSILEKTIYNISQYDHELQSPDVKTIAGITPANIIENIGVTGTFTPKARQQIFEVVLDIARAVSIKKSFGQPTKEIITGTEEVRRKRRTEFFTHVEDNTEILLKYLDVKINAKAKKILERVDTINTRLATESDGETLTSHDVSVEGVETVLVETIVSLKKIRRTLKGDVRSGIYDREKGLNDAKEALEKMARISTQLENAPGDDLPRLIVTRRNEEKAAIAWAEETGARLSKMDRKMIGNVNPFAAKQLGEFMQYLEPFMNGRTPIPRELIDIRQIDSKTMRNILETIRRIEENPKMFTQEELENLHHAIPEEQVSSVIQQVRDDLTVIIPEVLSTIDHPTARYLQIGAKVTDLEKDIQADLKKIESMRSPDAEPKMLRRARIEAGKTQKKLARLKRCQQMLQLLTAKDPDVIIRLNQSEYIKTAGRDSLGFYSYEDGRMYLNTERIKSEQRNEADILEHEMGHAIIDTFRRSGVFPSIMLSFHEKLKHQTTASGETFESLLISQAPIWGIEIGNPASPTTEEKWKMMDELANRYSLWNEDGKQGRLSEQARALYSLCEPKETVDLEEPVTLTNGVHMTPEEAQAAADERLRQEQEAEADAERSQSEGKDYEENLLGSAENKILNTDAFLSAYAEYADVLDSVYEYNDVKVLLKQARRDFKTNHYLANRMQFLKNLKAANTVLDSIKKDVMQVVDLAKSDLTHETKTGTRSMWRIITEDVNWVSISDVMAMFKDASEDIQRMWKRRGEASRNRLGKGITEMIHDDIPYLGRLKHEFERRDRTSEEEEVGVWEKGLEKIDPHDLMHEMVPRVKNKEQLKAIINLVTKKGRLDWDDHHLWDKLEYFSGYRMPRAACLRDSDLRNQWLQKMTADIWRDKEIFEHWKAENDSGIDSGRKHLDTYVEEISATGRLRTELRRLLYNFSRSKRGEILAKEEEVSPHLYEGIIYYAMRNGKMSMEEKFFYLVKGVDEGLLSVDRLRAFSGEAFGILNGFPFIDYFSSGQNCSKHEIKKIAVKITEKESEGKDPYKPGARMTKFLMEEVAFDKNVSDRVNKALKRAENIDHEDIPMLLTQVDYNGVNQIINFTSGSQAKVSAQAMQNGYVGYNSFLKYFAMKADIGHPPITERDIAKIASTLGAYSLWDNLITRNSIGSPATARPFLSWEQINDQSPVSGSEMTSKYRNSMNEFALELCQGIGISKVNSIPIEYYIGVDRQNPQLMENIRTATGMKNDEIYKNIEAGPQNFVTQLRAELSKSDNHAKLVELLRKKEKKFIPESSEFQIENVRQFWDDGDSNEHQAAAAHAH